MNLPSFLFIFPLLYFFSFSICIMIAMLAQVSPPLFERIQADFEVLDAIFFDGVSDDPEFAPDTDLLAVDYREFLEPLFQEIAVESGFQPGDYDDCPKVRSHPWYKAFSAANELVDYELEYGTTFHLPNEVQALALELASLQATLSTETTETGAEATVAIQEETEEGDFTALADFYRRAAERGCVVVSGIE
jgi:hypothetical protein